MTESTENDSPIIGDLLGLDKGLVFHYGFIGALLIHNFIYWIRKNHKKGRNSIEGKTWVFQSKKDLQAHFYYCSYKQIRTGLDNLIESGVLETGNFNKKGYDQTIWYTFVNPKKFKVDHVRLDKEIHPKPSKNSETQREWPKRANAMAQKGQPIPESKSESKLPLEEDNVSGDVAFQSKNKRTLNPSRKGHAPPKQRWKLTDSQMESFDWLQSLNLDTDEGTIAWWSRKYCLNRLKQAYFQSKDRQATNLAGYMQKLLKTTFTIVSENTEVNRQTALSYKKEQNWNGLKMHQDFVSCQIASGIEDLMLHLDPMYFFEKLMFLWESRA